MDVNTNPRVFVALHKERDGQAYRHQRQKVPFHEGMYQQVPTDPVYQPSVSSKNAFLQRQRVTAPKKLFAADVDRQPSKPKQDKPPISGDGNTEERCKSCPYVQRRIE